MSIDKEILKEALKKLPSEVKKEKREAFKERYGSLIKKFIKQSNKSCFITFNEVSQIINQELSEEEIMHFNSTWSNYFEYRTEKIYIIQSGNRPYYKVGKTSGYSIEWRLKDIQCGNPDKLSVYKYAFVNNLDDEQKCHKWLKEYKVRGEWFYIEDLVTFENMAKSLNLNLRDDCYNDQGKYNDLILLKLCET